MSGDPWAAYPTVPEQGRKPAPIDPWAAYPIADASSPPSQPVSVLTPTGAAHDGDTFALNGHGNARLLGVDAFELNQTGRTPDGSLVPLGQQARARALPFYQAGATVSPTGSATYGRPVVTVKNGGDPGAALLHDGLALAEPKYLANDPARLFQYVQLERLARLNRRGAHADTYQTPSAFRHGGVDPVSSPVEARQDQTDAAIFWDDPTPYAGLPKKVADGYIALTTNLNTTAADLLDYAKVHGFELDPKVVDQFITDRAKAGKASSDLSYTTKPRVLTNLHDGKLGAGLRGFADPLNLLDESGAVVDSLLPGSERENVWSSSRRFGDVYNNNLEQNRSILDFDDANHPYARFGGQLASGLVLPGASVEGLGLAAARQVLQAGGTRIAAKAAARRAVLNRLSTVGAVEGGVAGGGAGETWQDRVTGAVVGAPAGAVLGGLTGAVAPKIAAAVGKPFSKMAGREGEANAHAFTDGAIDAGRAGAQNVAAARVGPAPAPGSAFTVIDTAALHAASADASGAVDMGKAGSVLRQVADEALVRGDTVTLHVEGKVIPITKPGMVDEQGQRWGAMSILAPLPGENARLEITPSNPTSAMPAKPGNIADRPVGKFGPIHDDVAGDYHEAFSRMAADGAGEVPGAIQHPQLGPVDLIWGDGRYGLSKIASIHPEVVNDLPRIIARLPVVETPEATGNGKFVLSDETHRAIVAPDFDGEAKRWVVTAYERKGSAPGDQTSRRGPLMPDGGSTGSGAESGLRLPGASGNGRRLDRIDVNARPRLLTAGATDAERLAQAERIRPGDVLPLPASGVDGIEEAQRIGAGRYERIRAPNERDELERRNIRSPLDGTRTMPKRGPLDLVTWLRTRGGLKRQGGTLEHLGIDNAPRRLDFAGGEGRFGKLVSDDGMSWDVAAHDAWEAGYFPGHGEPPSISDFLDTLEATHSGRARAFHPDDYAEVDAFEAARAQRWDVEKAQAEGAPLARDRGEPVDMADLDHNSPPVEAYEEWGENAPNLAGNIRLDKLDSPQAIKRALVATDQRVGGFDAATRGRITHAETEKLAADLGMTADDLLKRRKGEAFSAEQALAARQILSRSGTDLVNLARRVARTDNAGDELEAAFSQAWLRHVAIQEQVAGMTAEAGRALSQFRMIADSRAVDRVLPSLAELTGGTARIKDVAGAIVDLERMGVDARGVSVFAAKALKPRFRDKLVELYINSMLSGPQTHAVNILSNTITALGQIPEHAVAATFGLTRKALMRAETDRVLMTEVGARTVGLLQGAKEGFSNAVKVMMTGNSVDPITKVGNHAEKAISGIKGSLIRTPTRALAAEDEIFKGMARRMELTGLATRQAYAEGLRGDAAKSRVAALIANPPDAMMKRAIEYGRYLTYQTPLGHTSITAGISKAAQGNLLVKLVVPFTRTPVNILKYAAERSLVAPLLKPWQDDIAAGGARRDLAVAKVVAGSGLMAMAMQWALGGHLTGGGPADKSAKRLMQADGWQPYSVRVGDRYYSYARLDPLATTLGVAADFAELQSHMTEKQKDQVAVLLATATAKNLSNKVWFSGAVDLSEAISDPERYWDAYARRMVGGLAVPSVSNQAARAVDPTLREARSILDAVKARVPGLSRTLPARRDVWGNPVSVGGSLGPDFASPIWMSRRRNDPVNTALLAAGASVGKPRRNGMTPEQFGHFQALAGQQSHAALAGLVQSPMWRPMSDSERAQMVKKLIASTRRRVRGGMFAAAPVSSNRSGAKASADPWAAFPVVH